MAILRQAVTQRWRSSVVPPRTRTKVSTEDSLAGMEIAAGGRDAFDPSAGVAEHEDAL
jgi:hypothetical protein